MNIQQLQHQARQCLTGDEAKLEIDVLLAYVLNKNQTFLRTWPEHELSFEQQQHFEQFIAQRQQGMPLAYILGEREFWRLSLTVSPDVLIPRPDTECVVEKVLALGKAKVWRVADLGTGSGAIALSLALERPDWQLVATDIHADSLAIARHNADKHQLHNVEFACGSWFEPLTGLFDCIVSNPPYIADTDPHLAALQHEPWRALVAAEQGLADLHHLALLSGNFLRPDGWLVLEHGFNQGEAVRDLVQQAGFKQVMTGKDYGGNDRYTVGQKC